VPFHTVPARKDQTDLELAVELALEKGARSITLVGGWGSRIDHALGNVELLYRWPWRVWKTSCSPAVTGSRPSAVR